MAASCKHAPPSVSYAGNLSSAVTLGRRIREFSTCCAGLSVKLTRVTMMYQPRYYRRNVDATDLVRFSAALGETDLLVLADTNLAEQALETVRSIRAEIQGHILNRREFVTSMEPLPLPEKVASADLPPVVVAMYRAAQIAGTGPMAAVAGAVAEAVGDSLLQYSRQVIVENGGDIFIKSDEPRTVSIYAGDAALSEKIGLVVPPGRVGICTSSATVGHAISIGCADAAVVVCSDTALADAMATALGNRVKSADDIEPALDWVQQVEGVLHAAVVFRDHFGTWGQFEVVPVGTGG